MPSRNRTGGIALAAYTHPERDRDRSSRARSWKFSIPPPFVNTSRTSGVWGGLDNAAWGSHIYFDSVKAYDAMRDARNDSFYGGRPITLTKFGLPEWAAALRTAALAP